MLRFTSIRYRPINLRMEREKGSTALKTVKYQAQKEVSQGNSAEVSPEFFEPLAVN